jgi:gamma-polyglutamate synthase
MSERQSYGIDVEQRVREGLPMLDVMLRDNAIVAVAERVRSLTADEIEDDATLVASLARVAVAISSAREAPRDDLALLGEARIVAQERTLVYNADRLDQALVALGAASGIIASPSDEHARLDVDTLLRTTRELWAPAHDRLVRERALDLARRALEGVPWAERQPYLGVDGLRQLRELALGRGARGFVQAGAIELITSVLRAEVLDVYREILKERGGKEAMIARYRVVSCAIRAVLPLEQKLELLQFVTDDPSEHVRQGLARALARIGNETGFERLLALVEGDSSVRVQGVALLELEQATRNDSRAWPLLLRAIEFCCSAAPVLRRAALHAIAERAKTEPFSSVEDALAKALQQTVASSALDVAEQAALLVRQLELQRSSPAADLAARLGPVLGALNEGEQARFELPPELERQDLERALCVHGAVDLPVSLRFRSERTATLQKGERRRSRLWRLRNELLNPAPDKRQNYLHARARTDDGDLVGVPLRMAEVTPTRVPGERRTAFGQSWGGFVPRVDDALFACEQGRERRLLCVFGTLVVTPPPRRLQRWLAWWRLQWRYAKLAQLRERSLVAYHIQDRKQFVTELGALGFRCHWENSQAVLGTRTLELLPEPVHAYYAFGVLLAGALPVAQIVPEALRLPIALWFEDALQYVLMPAGNTAWHLALVVWALLSFMIGRAAWVLSKFEQARRQIPLSLGGWGSRGKSGTERLKAALFHAQHYDVISKTTGCEAMMIVARRGQPASEIFLYRAYDKATIWEQARVVQYAQSLGAQVFLWECMALQPEFVNILNREWMRDPVTTITNAYPDHEDVMGPGGEDVARVIGQFIPKQGKVFCSEEQMLPILRQSARDARSEMVEVGGLEADLLPKDLLARFPYEEHPRNIALALRLAEHFGVGRERALVDLADYVYPDLGVLKTFPVIKHKQRMMRFSNGCSANERAGFLSNWERLGFAAHKPDDKPEILLMGVINNRADRVPRSRVFADVFARDAVVDSVVVIGTNQYGMARFISEAVASQSETYELPADPAGVAETVDLAWDALCAPRKLETLEVRLAIVTEVVLGKGSSSPAVAELVNRLRALEAKPPADLPTLHRQVEDWVQACAAALLAETSVRSDWQFTRDKEPQQAELALTLSRVVLGFAERVTLRKTLEEPVAAGKRADAQKLLQQYYHATFMRKVHVLPDSGSTGDQVIDFLARQLVPGLTTELMGSQNIKGTGLDFVYRFMSVDRVWGWLTALDERPEERGQLLTQMLGHIDYGLFDVQMALEHFERAFADPGNDWTQHKAQAEQVRQHLLKLESEKTARLTATRQRSMLGSALGFIEPWVDHLDAISRYGGAVATMRELAQGKLSQATAVERLRELMGRQKGGWLVKDVEKWLRRFRRAPTR